MTASCPTPAGLKLELNNSRMSSERRTMCWQEISCYRPLVTSSGPCEVLSEFLDVFYSEVSDLECFEGYFVCLESNFETRTPPIRTAPASTLDLQNVCLSIHYAQLMGTCTINIVTLSYGFPQLQYFHPMTHNLWFDLSLTFYNSAVSISVGTGDILRHPSTA